MMRSDDTNSRPGKPSKKRDGTNMGQFARLCKNGWYCNNNIAAKGMALIIIIIIIIIIIPRYRYNNNKEGEAKKEKKTRQTNKKIAISNK